MTGKVWDKQIPWKNRGLSARRKEESWIQGPALPLTNCDFPHLKMRAKTLHLPEGRSWVTG